MGEPLDFLPIAVRAYTPPSVMPIAATDAKSSSRSTRPRIERLPETVLVFDTETTTDTSQRLLFGSWRLYTTGECVSEGLFFGDDLGLEDRNTLQEYARTHQSETTVPEQLPLLTCRAFLKQVFWPLAYKARGVVVGFNLPFDLARLAVHCGTARSGYYAGGFSLMLATYQKDGETHENRFRPRIAIRSLDSKRALTGFTRPGQADTVDLIPEGSAEGEPDPAYSFPGYFLDLRTLAFALTNESHSLESACDAFEVEHGKITVKQHGTVTPEYIDYNRRDVLATWELAQKLEAEFNQHPISLLPTRAYSPASIGKSYLTAMGIQPVLQRQPDFPNDILGHAMAAYYGGRAECRIRRVPVPVVYLDFLSMYPTVNTLMGLWHLLTSKQIAVEEEATDAVVAFLDHLTLDECFDPKIWTQFVGLVQVLPEGDILPVRATYDDGGTWQIGVNPVTAAEPMWYTIPDVIASTLLTGKRPRVLRAVRFVARGQSRTLHPVALRRAIRVDPRSADFFRSVIEERKRLSKRTDLPPAERERLNAFLKVLANSSSYGIYAEMNREEQSAGEKTTVEVYGVWERPFTARVSAPEVPGEFCFPPIAACIAGAARLMLALLERCVMDKGGSYAMCDTDSMAIVASEQGGLVSCPGGAERLPDGMDGIHALSWAEVEDIRRRFEALNPYNYDAIPGSVLKLEDENLEDDSTRQRQLWCYAISAKRYALFNIGEDGEPIVRKSSEHGLGHLLNPIDPESANPDWMRSLWEGLVREALGRPSTWPQWLVRPAIGRISASSPEMLKPFAELNRNKLYRQQVKPFNFLLTAHVAPFGHPEGIDPQHFHLVAPYESDPRKWEKMAWANLYTGASLRYRITSSSSLYMVPNQVHVKTYEAVLNEYRTHPEAKSLGSDGRVCSQQTRGVLQRRLVTVLTVTHVGKESNRMEEVEAGVVHDPDEVYTEYEDALRDPWQTLVVQVLKQMPLRLIQEQTGLSRSQIKAVRNGHARPRPKSREALLHAAGAYARKMLQPETTVMLRGDFEACAAYLLSCRVW